MKKLYLSLYALALAILIPIEASAECVNTSTPSCGVYETCFANRCSCSDSKNEYFISYGKKYCEVFLNLPTLSSAGMKWRDSTLRCLQETIVPRLPPDGQASTCNCKSMQTIAYDSHVMCYTKPGASICNLPAADWVEILKATDPVGTLSDAKGRRQIVEVSKLCLPVLAGDAKAAAKKIIEKFGP